MAVRALTCASAACTCCWSHVTSGRDAAASGNPGEVIEPCCACNCCCGCWLSLPWKICGNVGACCAAAALKQSPARAHTSLTRSPAICEARLTNVSCNAFQNKGHSRYEATESLRTCKVIHDPGFEITAAPYAINTGSDIRRKDARNDSRFVPTRFTAPLSEDFPATLETKQDKKLIK